MKKHKTSIELDVDLVEQAREVLRTTGYKDTIDAALREVVAIDARFRAIEQLENLNVDAEALREGAWEE